MGIDWQFDHEISVIQGTDHVYCLDCTADMTTLLFKWLNLLLNSSLLGTLILVTFLLFPWKDGSFLSIKKKNQQYERESSSEDLDSASLIPAYRLVVLLKFKLSFIKPKVQSTFCPYWLESQSPSLIGLYPDTQIERQATIV